MPTCKICEKDSIFTVDVISKICNDCKKKQKIEKQKKADKQKIEKQKKADKQKIEKQTMLDNNLSLKYSILKAFKVFLILSMIGSTFYTIDWFITYLDSPSMVQEVLNRIINYYIIGYISSMFFMFCLIKMIDFLFDLDRKIDK